MTAHPGCRIRSIRPKDGSAKILVMPDHATEDRIACLRRVREILDQQGRSLAGVAFVAWDSNMCSSAFIAAASHSRIPVMAMPEFIKNRLIAAKIEEWSNEE